MSNQPTTLDHTHQVIRQRLAVITVTLRVILDAPCTRINAQYVVGFDATYRRANDCHEAQIQSISIEEAAEGFGDHCRDPQHLECLCGLFAR